MIKFDTKIDIIYETHSDYNNAVIDAFYSVFPDTQLLYKNNKRVVRLMTKKYNVELGIFNFKLSDYFHRFGPF
jgi:hypothetical protein